MTSDIEAMKQGQEMGDLIMGALTDWQNNAPRTRQSTARVLGMSEMGGCREYIRATIDGDPKAPAEEIKWAAFLGTAVGDFVENILGEMGWVTQEDVECEIPGIGIKVKGHLDARGPNQVIDFKTRDGLDEVRREGPSFKERAQISGYLIGLVQMGKVDEGGVGTLVYLDRSGKDPHPFTWSVNVESAYKILEAVVTRLEDVMRAMAAGESQGYLRDEPESYCWAIQCPFYAACWAGYTPTGKIEHPRELNAVLEFVEARDRFNEADALRKQKRENLTGVEGVTPEGVVVRWTLSESENGNISRRLDVRKPKGKK